MFASWGCFVSSLLLCKRANVFVSRTFKKTINDYASAVNITLVADFDCNRHVYYCDPVCPKEVVIGTSLGPLGVACHCRNVAMADWSKTADPVD